MVMPERYISAKNSACHTPPGVGVDRLSDSVPSPWRAMYIVPIALSGLLLGGCGLLGGIVFGCVVSWIMTATRTVRFPPGLARVYMVDSIPLIPTPLHIAAIAGICLMIVFLSSVWPAWKTSRQDPVTSLRSA